LCGGTILRTGNPADIGRFFRNHCRECPMGAHHPGRSCSMSDYTKEFLAMSKAYEASGGDPASLSDGRIAGLMVSHRRILRSNDAPGVHIEGEETRPGSRRRSRSIPGSTSSTRSTSVSVSSRRKDAGDRLGIPRGGGRQSTLSGALRIPERREGPPRDGRADPRGKHAGLEYSETHYHGEEAESRCCPRRGSPSTREGPTDPCSNSFRERRVNCGSITRPTSERTPSANWMPGLREEERCDPRQGVPVPEREKSRDLRRPGSSPPTIA